MTSTFAHAEVSLSFDRLYRYVLGWAAMLPRVSEAQQARRAGLDLSSTQMGFAGDIVQDPEGDPAEDCMYM